jgi:hypothetical protein
VLPERVVPGWWRTEGHRLLLEDLDEVLDELPDRLLVGTGAYQQMRPDLVRYRAARGGRLLLSSLRWGGLPGRPTRLGGDLLLGLQPALRVLPEPRHLVAGAGRARYAWAARRDDDRAAGERLPQDQLGDARTRRPQILEALPPALARGLELPIVYNTSAYDSLDSLRLLDGVVDVYMPDFKVWTSETAHRYLKRADYPEVARETIVEMNRQVGHLVVDGRGMARRGLIVSHLIISVSRFAQAVGRLPWPSSVPA